MTTRDLKILGRTFSDADSVKMDARRPYYGDVLTPEHDALLDAESSQISAWLDHLIRLETLESHVLAVVDLRSPIGLEIAAAATDEQHARAHLAVQLERGEVPSFSCAYPVPYRGESEAVRYVVGLVEEHVWNSNGGFIGMAAVDELDSIAVGLATLDRRSPEWGQIQWRAVVPGRGPNPDPGGNDAPW